MLKRWRLALGVLGLMSCSHLQPMREVFFGTSARFPAQAESSLEFHAKGDGSSVLQLAFPENAALKNPVSVRFRLEDKVFIATFDVRAPDIYGKEVFKPGEFPYQFDVVEIFLSVSGEPYPYYEFELTPYGQTYQVLIKAPRTPFQGGIDLGLLTNVERVASGWTAEMKIPLERLGWEGDAGRLIGNAYAILGRGPNRTFWAKSLPRQTRPNFHRPEFFTRFFPQD